MDTEPKSYEFGGVPTGPEKEKGSGNGGTQAQKLFLKFTNMTDLSVGGILKFLQNADFKGFDPVVIFEVLMKVLKAAGYDTEQKQFGVIFNLITYFVKRGTNFSASALQKSDPEVAKWMAHVTSTCKIQQKLKGSTNGLTLPRIAATFPHHVLALSAANEMRRIGEFIPANGMPEVFAYPGSPAMMSTTEWATWKEDYATHMVKVHRIINAKNATERAKDPDTVLAEQTNYGEIMVSSDINRKLLRTRRALAATICASIVATTKKRPLPIPEIVD